MAEEIIKVSPQVPCPACGALTTEPVGRFPAVPVYVGLLWATADAAVGCATGPLELQLCARCGYLWNSKFDPSKLGYELDYDNSLHHSPKFAHWERQLAESLVKKHDLRSKRIAEIGCGDGRFLALLCSIGDCSGIGFEPGHNAERVSDLVATADVVIYNEYVDADTLLGHGVDFVVARHVLEHIEHPRELIESIRDSLPVGGGMYVEVPSLSWAIDRGAFEDLMYEHCGYYTPATLAHQLRQCGFTDAEATSNFEGLFASAQATRSDDDMPEAAIDPETVESIRRGLAGFEERIRAVNAELSSRRDRGQRLAAWGGGARAVGLLNMVGSSDAIDLVVDLNPRKQGTFVAGTGHQIVAPDALARQQPDAVLVVNPVYFDEIAEMLKSLAVDADLFTV